ncbi:hypothetical protein [Pleionea litopenaei]|uniref:Uncharacterized protein n=1 Tax=Pleionea litopenaei TaxID=3070815 RepID=A0AA51RRC3_9GAMM|nr:hypothetical protein [Pleionea sp. HL-JVS1]WMS86099.1 hypothetical protein Q9312_12810 [Pleionea sp. HL-JVS1]
MIETINRLFSTLSSAAKTAKALQKLISDVDGDERVLLEEIKENAGLCWLVTQREIEPNRIIQELQTAEYDRIIKTDFDINRLKRTKLKESKRYKGTDLEVFIGKSTADLVENIYDRIKELKRIHRIDPEIKRIRWQVRFSNLHKRILLLLEHLKG